MSRAGCARGGRASRAAPAGAACRPPRGSSRRHQRGQRVGGGAALHLTLLEHDHALAKLAHQMQVVSRSDHRDPDILKAPEEPHDLEREVRVQISGGLIRDQERRLAHHRARDADPLLLADRELLRARALPAEEPRPGEGLAPVGVSFAHPVESDHALPGPSTSAAAKAAASNSPKSSGASPTPMKRIGIESSRATAITMPPRAVPSSLVIASPVTPTASLN